MSVYKMCKENEKLKQIYLEQQRRPQEYFQISDGNRLTGMMNKSLNYVFVPETVTEIGAFAFAGCRQLTGIFIPDTIKHIEECIFPDCPKLAVIVVDKENRYYDSHCACNAIIDRRTNELIAGCINTIIPPDIRGIGRFAFYRQTGLKSITIPGNIFYIEACDFRDCIQLVDVKLAQNLHRIGTEVFAGCVSLEDVYIPQNIVCIEENAFESVDHVWYCGKSADAPWGAWKLN